MYKRQIFAGAATLERLFHKRNLTLFIVLTGVCIGLLGLMSDFGTAAIFFVTFLVIAYMPVSYTHLDVYKRQHLSRSSSAKRTRRVSGLSGSTIPRC